MTCFIQEWMLDPSLANKFVAWDFCVWDLRWGQPLFEILQGRVHQCYLRFPPFWITSPCLGVADRHGYSSVDQISREGQSVNWRWWTFFYVNFISIIILFLSIIIILKKNFFKWEIERVRLRNDNSVLKALVPCIFWLPRYSYIPIPAHL